MKRLLINIAIVALAIMACGEAFAGSKNYKGQLQFSEPTTYMNGDVLMVEFDVDMSDLKLHKQQMIVLTPMLRYQGGNGNLSYICPPVVIAGKTRYKALERAMKFDHVYFEYDPDQIIKRKNGNNDQALPMRLSIPYDIWMSNAEIVVAEEVTGCSSCNVAYDEHVISSGTPGPLEEPNFVLSLIVPPMEQTKYRKEKYVSSLNFVVGRSNIDRDYKNNKERLDMIDRIMESTRNDRNISIQEVRIIGYTSPDGGVDLNMELSKKRALASVNYLKHYHGVSDKVLAFEWHGEDWAGLRDMVAKSQLPEKNQVLAAIDMPDVAKRKAKLRSMNYGETYHYLLGVYYPELRRDEYVITYIAKNFDPEEAREIIKTKPQQLSLNEMYMAASTYEVGSPEFKEIFLIASEYFPEDPIAQCNAGAVFVENGEPDVALKHLAGIEFPEALNNIGVAYVKKGDYGIASEYFLKAAKAGSQTAQENYDQLQSWMKIMD